MKRPRTIPRKRKAPKRSNAELAARRNRRQKRQNNPNRKAKRNAKPQILYR